MNPELSADFSVVELQERDRAAPAWTDRRRLERRADRVHRAHVRPVPPTAHRRRAVPLDVDDRRQRLLLFRRRGHLRRASHPIAQSDPEQLGLNALYRLYETADGWIFLAATNDKERHALERTLGVELPDGDDARAAVLAAAFPERKADEMEHELSRRRRRVRHASSPTAIPRSSRPIR